jgi:hypothetical protein
MLDDDGSINQDILSVFKEKDDVSVKPGNRTSKPKRKGKNKGKDREDREGTTSVTEQEEASSNIEQSETQEEENTAEASERGRTADPGTYLGSSTGFVQPTGMGTTPSIPPSLFDVPAQGPEGSEGIGGAEAAGGTGANAWAENIDWGVFDFTTANLIDDDEGGGERLPMPRQESPVTEDGSSGKRKRGAEDSDDNEGGDGDQPRTTRARRGVNTNVDAPEWYGLLKTYLERDVDCDEWQECVGEWARWERRQLVDSVIVSYGDIRGERGTDHRLQHQLPCVNLRPGDLSKWAKLPAGKRFASAPVAEDVGVLADEWLHWWKEMQPTVRKHYFENDLPAPLQPKHDILSLEKRGPAGLVMVLVGLKMWASRRETDIRWMAAVRDLRDCFKTFNRNR